MAKETLEQQVRADQLKKRGELSDKVRHSVDAVFDIEPTTPRAEIVSHLIEAVKALNTYEKFIDDTGLEHTNKDDRDAFNTMLNHIIHEGWGDATKELGDFVLGYDALLRTAHQLDAGGIYRTEGIFKRAYQNILAQMDAAQGVLGWAELGTKLSVAKADIQARVFDQNIAESVTQGIEDPAKLIATSLSEIEQKIDTLFTTDSATPTTPIALPSFDSKVKVTDLLNTPAGSVDRGVALTTEQIKRLRTAQTEMFAEEKRQRDQAAVMAILLPLRLIVSEILARDAQNKREKFNSLSENEKREQNYYGYFLRPDIKYVDMEGRDQAKMLLDLIGRDKVEYIETIALRLSTTEDRKDALSADEVKKLREIIGSLEDLRDEYLQVYIDGFDLSDTTAWDATNEATRTADRYIDWIGFILAEAGVVDRAEQATMRLSEPSLQDALEKWQEFFTDIARGRNSLDEMERWGDVIMNSFYQSAEPTESFNSKLETRRFSGWKNALNTVAAERRAAGNKAEADKYIYLVRKFDDMRKVTDAMVTYGQSRSITADWHDEGMRKRLKGESIALRDFTPEQFDWLMTEYKYSTQYLEVIEWMRIALLDPDSTYARGGWKSDNSSKEALKKEMRQRLVLAFPSVPHTKDGDDYSGDVAEIVDIAYTSATFAALNMDTFAESHILGDSPAVVEVKDRIKYFRIAPFVEYFYGAYKEPRFLVEMLVTHEPKELIKMWRARFPKDDYQRRIDSIQLSIWASEHIYEEHAPMRKHDEQSIGYEIELNNDGMLKWPYPSMYRFLFDPVYAKLRRENNYAFSHWVDGYEAFVDYREAAYADIKTDGKDGDDAVEYLMGKFDTLLDKISPLKGATAIVDWNYIFVLMASFVDRMFISLQESGNDSARKSLWNRVSKKFGYKGDLGERMVVNFALKGAHLPADPDRQARNNLNSLDKVIDPHRLRSHAKKKPVAGAPNTSFAGTMYEEVRKVDGRDGERNADRRRGEFHVGHALGDNFIGNLVTWLEHRAIKGFEMKFGSFKKTIDILGSSLSKQATAVGEQEKK